MSRRRFLALLAGVGTSLSVLSLSAAAATAVPRAAAPGPASVRTFVKAYTDTVNGVQVDLSPVAAQGTSDGGSIAVALAETPNGVGGEWLVKLGATGAPQWQEEVACGSPDSAPGDYADGVAVQQTSDGGYVVAGGTVNCGSGATCAPLGGLQCAMVQKFDAAGRLTWARAYLPGAGITQIRQTGDGGYIAAGTYTSATDTGALLLKLTRNGTVQWQRRLGPDGGTRGYFNAVRQAADGGYVAAGDYYRLSPGVSRIQVLVARFASNGTLTWEHGFATQTGSGPPASISNATSIVQTADGGYAVAGGWNNPTRNSGNGARGALLLKLDASGTLQWQKAYSGSFCPPGNSCLPIGGYAYSMQQTPDGGYILSGDTEDVTPSGGLTLVPWLAKASTGGALLWQQDYYQILQRTGNALTEYFPATAQTTDGGFASVGNTENYSTQKDELYLVKSNGTGTSNPGCGDLHPPLPLHGINPGLAPVAPGLTVQAPAPPVAAASPVTATPTAITTTTDC